MTMSSNDLPDKVTVRDEERLVITRVACGRRTRPASAACACLPAASPSHAPREKAPVVELVDCSVGCHAQKSRRIAQ